jgi:small ligand-binding sensory domain FIST
MVDQAPARFRVAHAGGDDWRRAVGECTARLGGGPFGLGFLYVADVWADRLPDILSGLRQATGVRDWVGSVGIGVSADDAEYWDEPAIAVLVASLPAESWRLLSTLEAGPPAAADAAMPVAVVHADPRCPDLGEVLAAAADATPAFLVGGLTSSRGACYQVANRVTRGSASGVLLAPEAGVQAGLTQGCRPLGEPHRVTESADTVVMTLDGVPALEILRHDLAGLRSDVLARIAGNIHVALPISGADRPDYLVRNLVGVDPERGWLAIGDRIAVGDRLMFVRRDADSARADLEAMLARLRSRLAGPPAAGLYFSCVARGVNMFGGPGVELRLIRDTLGRFPLAGMACAGEICNGRLYGYTGVLAVFS